MKIGRSEKIWLSFVLLFEVIFNLPGVPPYGDITGCIVHGLISFTGMLLSVYLGYAIVIREYPLREDEKQDGEPSSAESKKQSAPRA